MSTWGAALLEDPERCFEELARARAAYRPLQGGSQWELLSGSVAAGREEQLRVVGEAGPRIPWPLAARCAEIPVYLVSRSWCGSPFVGPRLVVMAWPLVRLGEPGEHGHEPASRAGALKLGRRLRPGTSWLSGLSGGSQVLPRGCWGL